MKEKMNKKEIIESVFGKLDEEEDKYVYCAESGLFIKYKIKPKPYQEKY